MHNRHCITMLSLDNALAPNKMGTNSELLGPAEILEESLSGAGINEKQHSFRRGFRQCCCNPRNSESIAKFKL